MGITRLYSADMYVHDLDGAIEFYVGKLGFEKRADELVDEEGHRWVEVAPQTDSSIRLLMAVTPFAGTSCKTTLEIDERGRVQV